MKTVVLDASALLALLFDESGAGQVEKLLNQAVLADRPLLIGAINWAEVLYRVQRKQGEPGFANTCQLPRTMPLEIVPLDQSLAEAAAQLKSRFNLGLADACAAALAKIRQAELITADLEFRALAREIRIGWLK